MSIAALILGGYRVKTETTSGDDRDGRLASHSYKTMQFFFFFVLFLPLVPQVILGFITYSREELLDIRVMSTLQHYDLEYIFPEADPMFGPPPRTMDWIPAGDRKQRHRRRDRRSVFWSGSVDGNIAHCSQVYY